MAAAVDATGDAGTSAFVSSTAFCDKLPALGFEVNAQLLSLLDLLTSNDEPLSSPPQPAQADAVAECRIDLALASALQLRLLERIRPAVTPALGSVGLVLRISVLRTPALGGDPVDPPQESSHWLTLQKEASSSLQNEACSSQSPQQASSDLHATASRTDLLTAGELFELTSCVEEALGIQPAEAASKMEAAAQAALRCCCDLVSACEPLLESGHDMAGLAAFRMVPVVEYDASVYGGTVAEVMGPTGLAAMTGFQTLAHEGSVSMPNFRQWTPDSEFVAWKTRRCTRGRKMPMGRLWSHMMSMCLRAPCHEVIHLLQHLFRQKMNGQVAEHDGYFASALLSAAVRGRHAESVGYPGMLETALLADMVRASRIISSEEEGGWAQEETGHSYTRWRDSFGVEAGLWNDLNFNGHDNKGTEFKCGSMLTLEAACCQEGQFVDELDVDGVNATVNAMLSTMFKGRCNKNCNGVGVEVHSLVDLSRLSLTHRLALASEPVGAERACALLHF